VAVLIAVSIPVKIRIATIVYLKVPAIAVHIARQLQITVPHIKVVRRAGKVVLLQVRHILIRMMRRITMIRKISIMITMMISMDMKMQKITGMRTMNRSK
jgi:hypothetical protein